MQSEAGYALQRKKPLVATRKPVGGVLRNHRIARNLTQIEVAKRANIPQGQLSNIELGETDPAWSLIADIASAIGVSLDVIAADTTIEPLFSPLMLTPPAKAHPTPRPSDLALRSDLEKVASLTDTNTRVLLLMLDGLGWTEEKAGPILRLLSRADTG